MRGGRSPTTLSTDEFVFFNQTFDAVLVNVVPSLKDTKRPARLLQVQKRQNDVVVRSIPKIVHHNECVSVCLQDCIKNTSHSKSPINEDEVVV